VSTDLQAASTDLICLDKVVRHFGPVVALSGVSLHVHPGEFIALLGPSGCGKTTLLRTIAGFVEPSAGKVWIDGRDMSGVPPNKRPVNTVFQHYALFPHYTVAQNIAFGPRRRGIARNAIPPLVDEVLSLVGMEGFADRLPSQLSGGQQQRVALARAIVNRPKVLLLDEPLGALDLKLRKRMQIELKNLHRKLGITFIYVTHDQEEALTMADRIAVMSGGSIVQLGTGEEIYRTPNSRYVADFIGEANLLSCNVDSAGNLRFTGTGTALPYRSNQEAGSSATLMIRPEDIAIGRPSPGMPTVAIDMCVADKIFVGDGVKLFGQITNGIEIIVHSANRLVTDQIVPGDTVTVHWAISDGRILDA
jgi:spermidine/putrescine transport system ATP-binding protein